MTAEHQFQLVANIILAGAFIGAFYFTIATSIEAKTVRKNVRSIFPDVSLPDLPSGLKSEVCKKVKGLTDAWGTPSDADVVNNNEQLKQESVGALKKLLIAGSGLLALIYFTRSSKEAFSFHNILTNTVWSMSAIVLAEITFFYLIIGNATYVDQQDVVLSYLTRQNTDDKQTKYKSLY